MGAGRLLLELASYVSTIWGRLYLSYAGVNGGKGFRCWGLPIIRRRRGSTIRIGDDCRLRNWFATNEMGVMRRSFLSTRYPEAELTIGNTFRSSGVVISAEHSIRIGERVTIGANTTIVDSDFHPLDPAMRSASPKEGNRSAVEIGNDIFIGMHCLILKGTTIGDGCVVGAGSVVSGKFPAGSIIGGNPARIIRGMET